MTKSNNRVRDRIWELLLEEVEKGPEALKLEVTAENSKRQPTPTFRRNPGLIMLRGVVGEAVDDGRDRELL